MFVIILETLYLLGSRKTRDRSRRKDFLRRWRKPRIPRRGGRWTAIWSVHGSCVRTVVRPLSLPAVCARPSSASVSSIITSGSTEKRTRRDVRLRVVPSSSRTWQPLQEVSPSEMKLLNFRQRLNFLDSYFWSRTKYTNKSNPTAEAYSVEDNLPGISALVF